MEDEKLPVAAPAVPGRLTGRAVEDAAVAWVMDFERREGRLPADRRYVREFAADLESMHSDGSRRLIEIKATATSYRGWFLPLEPVQFEHAGSDPEFYIYVVENVGQGDPDQFAL